MTDTPIIRIMDLTKAYGPKTAVDHLNLEIRRGEIEIGRASCRERV